MKIILAGLTVLCLFAFERNIKKKSGKTLKKSFAFVPSGKVFIEKDSLSVQSFYISKTEVTNGEYKAFLIDLKASNNLKDYAIALPDTSKWQTNSTFFSAFKDYYFSHPSYRDYPVVNVSYEGAQLYCAWFSKKFNASSKEKFNDFRLPTREEFIRACRGDDFFAAYAWNHPYVRDKKENILCNHLHYPDSKIAASLSDNSDVLAPAKSYWPNKFGIYNLNGNAAEMIHIKGKAVGGSWKHEAKDVQNESVFEFKEASPNVGFRMVSTFLKK
jgi:formylglycine-generating enzyme required for sulfatase activity